jgi:hypothetical protein
MLHDSLRLYYRLEMHNSDAADLLLPVNIRYEAHSQHAGESPRRTSGGMRVKRQPFVS